MGKTYTNDQNKHPLFDALVAYVQSSVVPFDVPGHKMGRGIHPKLKEFVGENVLKMDVNSSPSLDILSNPEGVIFEAEKLAAKLFKADNAFFLVNGSTSGVQNMMMAVLKPGDKVLIPRNIHKSAINGLVLTGAIPIFLHPEIEPDLGFAVGTSIQHTKEMIDSNLDAKAIMLLNPTYYGFTGGLKEIVSYAHKKGMIVMVDESHGSHFVFDNRFGVSAMEAGADLSTISMHKTGGSFTQSSILLHQGNHVSKKQVRSAINVLQTSSASYLLMASLDMARHQLASNSSLIEKLIHLSLWATKEINQIPGIRAVSDHVTVHGEVFLHDVSKLLIDVHQLGLSGHEAYEILRTEYGIQCEVGETNVVLAILSIGDTEETVTSLVSALKSLSLSHRKSVRKQFIKRAFFQPDLRKSPREAFFSETEYVSIDKAIGRISADQIMIYPPGIPLLIPGEQISEEILEEFKRLYEQGNIVLGSIQNHTILIKVLKEE